MVAIAAPTWFRAIGYTNHSRQNYSGSRKLKSLKEKNLPTAALAASILGLVICPYLYIAIGALTGFNLAFSLLILPLFLLSSVVLFWRFLSKPKDKSTNIRFILLEIVCWTGVIAFLGIISGFTLMTVSERIGLSSAFFLLASVGILPLILFRNTNALEQRLMRLPSGITIIALIVVLTLSGLATMTYLLGTPAFIL